MSALEKAVPNKLEYATELAKSNLLPAHYQKQPANLLYAIEFAEALGMKPIHAITSVHVIHGRPTASADLIGSLVRKAGHKLRVAGDETFAEAVLVRSDDPDFEFRARWDLAKARQAGLNTDMWRKYPGAMLRARAITEVSRAGAPDALHGIQYSTEELQGVGGSKPAQAVEPAESVEAILAAPEVEGMSNEQWNELLAACQQYIAQPAEVVAAASHILERELRGPGDIPAGKFDEIVEFLKEKSRWENNE